MSYFNQRSPSQKSRLGRSRPFGATGLWVPIAVLGSCLGCADVTTTPVSATYADGYAAPGESAQVVFHTRRSLSGHLYRVTVAGGDLLPAGTVLYEENSDGFGMYLQTPTDLGAMDMLKHLFVGDPMHPQSTVEIPVPADSTRRGRTPLELRVECSRAVSSGIDNFAHDGTENIMQVPITVVNPGWEWPIRLRDVVGRFLVGMGLLCFSVTLWDMKAGPLRRVPDFVLALITVGALYAILIFSSDPLAGNLGIVQTGYRALIWLGCIAGSATLGDRLVALLKKLKPTAGPPASESATESPVK